MGPLAWLVPVVHMIRAYVNYRCYDIKKKKKKKSAGGFIDAENLFEQAQGRGILELYNFNWRPIM